MAHENKMSSISERSQRCAHIYALENYQEEISSTSRHRAVLYSIALIFENLRPCELGELGYTMIP